VALSAHLVEIFDYDPEWKGLFEAEKLRLEQVFSFIDFDVEHVGSTAVEGLGAKPIIDIMVGVDDLASVESNIANLEALDYSYQPEHERLYPERRFFQKPRSGPHQYHLHCVTRDTEFYRDHIFFRNHLAENPDVAGEYLALKKMSGCNAV